MDGTNNNFFVLANENIVPDLDVYTYLKKLRYRNLNIISRKLTDGKTLEIIIGENEYEGPKIGMNVTIEAEYVSDGIYKTEEWNRKYVVKNSMIASIIHEVTYKTKDGIEIMVEQKIQEYYLKGEKVWINEKQAENREYRVIGARNIVVKEGKILKKKMF